MQLDAARLELVHSPFQSYDAAEPLDFIYSNDVMEHVADPRAVFRTALRLLKPGGVVVSNIDLGGHNVFANSERPLDFLTCPDWLWNLMFSHVATTNRVRLPEFVEAAIAVGLRTNRLDVLRRADVDYLASLRPHLLPRYGSLPDLDLLPVQCVLVSVKPATAGH